MRKGFNKRFRQQKGFDKSWKTGFDYLGLLYLQIRLLYKPNPKVDHFFSQEQSSLLTFQEAQPLPMSKWLFFYGVSQSPFILKVPPKMTK